MKKSLTALSIGLMAAFAINADVTYTFKNGEVADANKINKNFSDLDARIASLKAQVNSQSNNGANGYTSNYEHPANFHDVPIKAKKATSAGDKFVVGGKEYVIVATPIVGFHDGSRHILYSPATVCDEGFACSEEGVYEYFNQFYQPTTSVYEDSQKYGDVYETSNVSQDQRFQVRGGTGGDAALVSLTSSYRFAVSLTVKGSVHHLSYSIPVIGGKNITDVASNGDADYTNDFDWDDFEFGVPDLEVAAELLSLIRIEAL